MEPALHVLGAALCPPSHNTWKAQKRVAGLILQIGGPRKRKESQKPKRGDSAEFTIIKQEISSSSVQDAIKFLTEKNQPLALFCVSPIKEKMNRFSQARNLFSILLLNGRQLWLE